jgi:hypothetical protein
MRLACEVDEQVGYVYVSLVKAGSFEEPWV